jgi:acyl-CoA synthetase (AMP-forming)/AMP-acid ligase II
MQLDALLTAESIFGPGVSNALTKELKVLTISEVGGTPSLFQLNGRPAIHAVDTDEPGPDDIATLLYTSGTTSRPKKVPQKQKNRVAHLDLFGRTLEIEPGQRCLNMMPMHHTTGLAAEFLCPLIFGASVAFADFNPATFELIVTELEPTWFNLVPSMHQMVQRALGGRTRVFRESGLRFARSSSARMPVELRRQLESSYGVPLVDFYGATESGSMAFSGLSGTDHRTGSVGKATHDQVIVTDLDGQPLPPGTPGEICVGGPTVIEGYEHNDEANAKAFRDGWYRTGDEGYFDEDGFLFITGRLSEVVNRGGEKFSLSEIDEALLGCENVVTGAAFTAQHPTLGSEIYAAVVLEPGANTTPAAIRSYLATHLSWAKVPKVIFLVDELPYNSTGKVQKDRLIELI